MTAPSFAVVVPTFNRADLVMRTLESIFAQTHPAAEVIVVDNASTDSTAAVLTPLAESGRITFVRHPENLERAASRNTGMERASADYVTLLDSDDLMYPTALESAAAYVRANSGTRLFHVAYELVDTEGRRLHTYRLPSLADPLRAITAGNFMSCIGNFMHREIYGSYRFDTTRELSGSEDWEFWLRVLADHRPGRIAETNFAIVRHPGQTLSRPDVDAAQERLALLVERVRADPHLARVYAPYMGRLEAGCFVFLAYLANENGDRRAFDFLRQARRRRPAVVLSAAWCRSVQRAMAARLRRGT